MKKLAIGLVCASALFAAVGLQAAEAKAEKEVKTTEKGFVCTAHKKANCEEAKCVKEKQKFEKEQEKAAKKAAKKASKKGKKASK